MGSCKSDVNAKSFIYFFQDVFQKQVLVTPEAPSQWELKWSKNSDGIQIDNVQVRNQMARKMVQNIDKIIEMMAVTEESRR